MPRFSMTAKMIKQAGKATETRLKALKRDDRAMESLKRKADEMVDHKTHQKNKRRRNIVDDDEEEEEELRFEFDVSFF